MIVTENKNRKIKICDQILEEIYSQVQKNDYDPEKGGIIVGRENLNNENIILEYISKPLKNDICTRTRYTRKDEGHLKYFPIFDSWKDKNGYKPSKHGLCSRFLFRNDMCYIMIFLI